MKTFYHLFSGIEQVPPYSWRGVFEHTRRFLELLLRVPLVASAVLSCEVGLAAADFVKRVYRLKRQSGLLYTALYLKACRVALQRYYAGYFNRHESMSVQVSLTRTGLPRIIPSILRHRIRRRDKHAMQTFWLESIYRGLVWVS